VPSNGAGDDGEVADKPSGSRGVLARVGRVLERGDIKQSSNRSRSR
jgi:hypothetical protein